MHSAVVHALLTDPKLIITRDINKNSPHEIPVDLAKKENLTMILSSYLRHAEQELKSEKFALGRKPGKIAAVKALLQQFNDNGFLKEIILASLKKYYGLLVIDKGETCLHAAARAGKKNLVESLLQLKGNIFKETAVMSYEVTSHDDVGNDLALTI